MRYTTRLANALTSTDFVGLPKQDVENILCNKAHRGLYQASLLWALAGTCLEDRTHDLDLELHPFYKLDLKLKPTPNLPLPLKEDKETAWSKIIQTPSMGAVKSALATPIKQVLNWPSQTPTILQPRRMSP